MRDLRNLPPEVLTRLAAHDVDIEQESALSARYGAVVEARVRKVEVRANTDGTVGLSGYATVYDFGYRVGGTYGWTETIVAGACDKSIAERDDVRLLFDHDGIPLGRTKSGTMVLTSDDIGLLVEVASLDRTSPLAMSVISALERGDLDEMSFGFQVTRQEWDEDYENRRILEVKLFDVSVVTYPANPATVVGLRADAPPVDAGTVTAGPVTITLASTSPADIAAAIRGLRAAVAPVEPVEDDEDEDEDSGSDIVGDSNTSIVVNIAVTPDMAPEMNGMSLDFARALAMQGA